MPTRRSSTTSARPTPCAPASSLSVSSSATGPNGSLSIDTGVPASKPICTIAGASGPFAGSPVITKMGSGAARGGHLARGGERPGHRRAEEVRTGVDGASAQRGENEVAHELLAQIFDHAIDGTRALGLVDQSVELRALPHVGGETQDPGAILLAQPGNDRRRIESARVGEHHQRSHQRAPVGLCIALHINTDGRVRRQWPYPGSPESSFTRTWTARRARSLRVMTSTASSPAIVPITSCQPT